MALVDMLGERNVPPEVAQLFQAVEREYGFVPNILRVMAHCPDLVTVFVPLWAQVYKSPSIGPRLRALAALGTAKAQDCTYCVAHMTASARRAGVAEEQISAVGDLLDVREAFEDREALILETADVLTRDPDGVTDELRARLTAEFGADEIVNIVLAIGMYNLTSRFLKALAIDVESVFDAAAPQPTTA
ncbi:carboxymuconolactone decarboxylase family protein [Lentzea terrae]|jgi:uncharacterized peroxidase-related enzyme|uniref:carboxymuconolactone decarboxylase family protein n=1 Tax=Lentzea terrae TaxID=2200761 RepID=UPI000DD46B10|nr:carboxymuconolactone decarboxylase family protein [Lentzea terrae]